MKMIRKAGFLGCLLLGLIAAAAPVSNKALLLRSYIRVMLIQRVPGEIQQVIGRLTGPEEAEVQVALANWSQTQMTAVRQELNLKFGEKSREQFEQFVAEYTAAEAQKDARYLRSLVGELGFDPSECATYSDLRKAISTAWLQPDIQGASQWLSNLQTWLKLRGSTPHMPALEAWQARDQPVSTSQLATAPEPPPSAEQLLAAAEAAPGAFKADPDMEKTPRSMFAEGRKKKQDRRMAEAQASMQQIATERQSAEQELAAKKQTEAQAEAEAVRNQAQKLAATEKQALEQQENSWGNKLKAVVGSTVSAAGGAFFGGIGSQAGQMAANALFQLGP